MNDEYDILRDKKRDEYRAFVEIYDRDGMKEALLNADSIGEHDENFQMFRGDT